MKRFLNMTIATPEGVIFEGEVDHHHPVPGQRIV